ncbi:MAG: hypothetical protein R2867_03160 [Caldilineaceae bacterium]
MGNTLYYGVQIPIGMVWHWRWPGPQQPIRAFVSCTIYYTLRVYLNRSRFADALDCSNKELGIFNYVLDFVGLGPYGWLQSTTAGYAPIMGMEVWLGWAHGCCFLAGLQSISNDCYEAAVDGIATFNLTLEYAALWRRRRSLSL